MALTYADMDWDWLVRNAKLRDRQNRLGFAVSLACEVSEANNDIERTQKLQRQLEVLESARLLKQRCVMPNWLLLFVGVVFRVKALHLCGNAAVSVTVFEDYATSTYEV